ncbi:MAG TPA: PEP/pyruvate-binding domain-containing protein [Solirubrobacteraceae bacterium]|nr:PEP/pyruvate-binding domain-containing protein [Solirubrobacteraceae bacterium]
MTLLILSSDTAADRDLLGGKAWSITEMLRHQIPVPPAFTIGTDECARYYDAGKEIPSDVLAQLPDAMAHLEKVTQRTFGAGERPLLVSVRSGAPISMPGMMDTILNLGMTTEVERALERATGSASYAADTMRRFQEQFEHVVGEPAPSDPWDQLKRAIAAVFDSWHSDRAVVYRRERQIPEDLGTAVTVQAMVFGNLDDRSGTGVLFSRDPTGASTDPYGEWLPMGQGEDVVSGNFDPLHLDELHKAMPDVHAQLLAAAQALDEHHDSAMDIEFTVESGRLWLLQSRKAKVHDQTTGPTADAEARAGAKVLATGKPACPGFVTGTVVTDVEEAEARALEGEDIILARVTTNPHDVSAMSVVAGILTEVGGATSHAAVVSRELSVPCIVGIGTGTTAALAGQVVTLDARSGEVLEGAVPASS